MPTPTSPTELLDLVRRSGVLTDDVLARLENGPPLPETPGKLAAALVKQGLLTQFQAKLLLAGKHRGFKLGAYIVRDQLGQGGMGAVYLAEHDTLRRKVALKVLTADKDQLAVKRFAREARAAAALDHPNIVRLFDVAKDGNVQYLVMEYVDGQTLDALMVKNSRLPYTQVADLSSQVATGLHHAFEKGFVHRDIKPANLMVNKSGQAKILDMGLARSGDAGDKLTEMMDKGAVVGTADYISPEQAIYGSCDIRSDIYALGATMYHLIAGRAPYEGTTTQKLVAHQMKTPPKLSEIVEGVPVEFAEVVERMMAKKPEDRYQTPVEVAAALSAFVPLVGTASSVDLTNPLPAQPGASTKRLNKANVKTDVTPIAAVKRPAAANEPVVASDPQGFSDFDVIAQPSRSGITPSPSSRSRKHKTGKHKAQTAATPAWAIFLAAGVGGFVVVGAIVGAVMALGGSSKSDSGNAAPPPAQVGGPPQAQPAPAGNEPPSLVNLNPTVSGQNVKVLTDAARIDGSQGKYLEAAAKYVLAVRVDPNNNDHWRYATALLAMAGDANGYYRLRKEMIAKFGGHTHAPTLERTAKACLLMPDSDQEINACALMADKAVQNGSPTNNRPYYELAKAMAEYRQGQYAAAEQRLSQLPANNLTDWNLTAVGKVVRALSQHRLGQIDAARETLTDAVQQLNGQLPNGQASARADVWQDWLVFQVLYKEAESQLGTPAVRPLQ